MGGMSAIKQKLILLAVALLSLGVFFGYMEYRESRTCMGVRVVSDKILDPLTEDPNMDISEILIDGKRIGGGRGLSTIFVSQPEENCGRFSWFRGELTLSQRGLKLYFLKNAALQDVPKALETSRPLKLIVTDGSRYRQINVVVTTLPVLYLEQETKYTRKKEKEKQEILVGSYLLLGKGADYDAYQAESGHVEWHRRGGTSKLFEKCPLKLSLKDETGKKENRNFLGLGSDDDWILNSMVQDDTKVREISEIQFWNLYLAGYTTPYPMSGAEYVELIVEGEYRGLFLLQRRVDRKYLNLDKKSDILFKGVNTWEADTLPDGYEIVYSPYGKEETYGILADVLEARGENGIDLDSFLETSLYLNYLAARDNRAYKNMFYALRWENGHYALYFVPWDTDMSMGIEWNEGFLYDYEVTMGNTQQRFEYPQMEELYPDLAQRLSARWNRQRENIYTEENILDLLEANIRRVNTSGAYYRDNQRWGMRYDGADDQEQLLRWARERLDVLDEFYR